MILLRRRGFPAAFAVLLVAGVALGQGMPPPPTEDDMCRNRCLQDQAGCMIPCATAPGAELPENQASTMACVKKCTKKSSPCLEKCDKESAKRGDKKAKAAAR